MQYPTIQFLQSLSIPEGEQIGVIGTHLQLGEKLQPATVDIQWNAKWDINRFDLRDKR